MKIESLDHKGRGIGKIDGKITFVENALPGEEVDITLIQEKKKYNEAIINKINKVSKNRVDAKCPYYFSCGGCQLLHLNYQDQLIYKNSKINNIFDKYIDNDCKINSIVYDKQYLYRNKIKLQVNNKVGLYKNGSNDIVSIDNCLICSKKINNNLSVLKKLDLSGINYFIIRISDDESILFIKADKDVDVSCIYNDYDNIVVKTNKLIIKKGCNYINKKIGSINYQISAESFFQVNYSVMKKMYDLVKKYVKGDHSVLDLYCGTGSISLYISKDVDKICGVEINKQSIVDANKNKQLNNISNVYFYCSDTKDVIINDFYDTIVVDPPRLGLNKHIINQIINSKSKQVVYISCDPMTLVRDLKELSKKYNIIEVTPFDMFPNTYHVECVCLLKIK